MGQVIEIQTESLSSEKSFENTVVGLNCISVYEIAMMLRQLPGKHVVKQLKETIKYMTYQQVLTGPVSKLGPETLKKLPNQRTLLKPWNKKDNYEKEETLLVLAALGTGFDPAEKLDIHLVEEDRNAEKEGEKFVSKLVGRTFRLFGNRREKTAASKFLSFLDTSPALSQYVSAVDDMNLHELEYKVAEILETGNEKERWGFLFALLRNPKVTRARLIKQLRFGSIDEVLNAFQAIEEDKIPYFPKQIVLEDEKRIRTPWIEFYMKFLAAREGKELDLNFAVPALTKLFMDEMQIYEEQIQAALYERDILRKEAKELKKILETQKVQEPVSDANENFVIKSLKQALKNSEQSRLAKKLYHMENQLEGAQQENIELTKNASRLRSELNSKQYDNFELSRENKGLTRLLDLTQIQLGLIRAYTGKRFLVVCRGTVPGKYLAPIEELGGEVETLSVQNNNVRVVDNVAQKSSGYDFLVLPIERSTHSITAKLRDANIPLLVIPKKGTVQQALLSYICQKHL